MLCPHCKGKIEFPAEGLGEQITCPHCSEKIVLNLGSKRVLPVAVGGASLIVLAIILSVVYARSRKFPINKPYLTQKATTDALLQMAETDIEKLKRKAAQGNADAQYALGNCYSTGQNVAEDYAEAVKWFRKAAERNNIQAQYKLGVAYLDGIGIAKNHQEGAKWFRKAAEQNYPAAQFELGICYLNGLGVEKDSTQAVKWCQNAAESNYAKAQCMMGLRYANGDGVETDNVKSYMWILLAAAQGDEVAEKAVPVIESKLSQKQIAEGQKLALNFKPR